MIEGNSRDVTVAWGVKWEDKISANGQACLLKELVFHKKLELQGQGLWKWREAAE